MFDTVKNSAVDLINCEGLLYSSVLSGLHPTFSLNQAIDSTALLNIVGGNDKFLDFIRDRHIRVALFGNYTGEKDAITLFLTNKLSECIDKDKASFKFSCLPFLYTEEYTEQQRIKIYRVMRDILKGDKTSFSSFSAKDAGMDTNSDDVFKIENYLSTVKKIVDSINGHYILPGNNSGQATLYEKVIHDIDILNDEVDDSDLCECSKEFKKLLIEQKQQGVNEQVLNSRSNMYGLIKILECSKNIEKELKSIVDLCYNEVVAASIADDEDDIMIHDSNCEYAQIYTNVDDENNIDKVNQKLSIVRHSKSNHQNVLTWDLLDQILREATPDKNNLDKWFYDMEKYCKQLGLENIKLGRKKLLIGAIPFGITVLSNVALVALLQHPYFDDTVGPQFIAGVAEDFIKNHFATIITDNILVPIISSGALKSPYKLEDLKTKIKENELKQDAVKQLVSQVSLLKKDYSNRT